MSFSGELSSGESLFSAQPRNNAVMVVCSLLVLRRSSGLAVTAARQVVDKRQPEARRDRANLMHTVGIESCERHLCRIGAVQVKTDFMSPVTNDQFASIAGRRQNDHQGREHPRNFLRVPMLNEKAARIVDQKFVQFG